MQRVVLASITLALFAVGWVIATPFQEDAPLLAKPTKFHEILAKECGRWAAEFTMAGAPAEKGIETLTMAHGGLWQVSEFKGSVGGNPFSGTGLVGYDPIKARFVSTWVDSMSGSLTIMEGLLSKDGKSRTMTFHGPSMAGLNVAHKHVHEWTSPDKRTLTSFETDAKGNEVQTMSIVYTRLDKTDPSKQSSNESTINEAKALQAKKQCDDVRGAVLRYYLKYTKLPDDLAILLKPDEKNYGEPWIQEGALSDPWGNQLEFVVEGRNGRKFTIVALGADGVAGGDSFDADISSSNRR